MTELPDECDFCDRVLEEDEELSPVWIGSMPDPHTEVARETAEKVNKRVGANSVQGNPLVLGRPIGQIKALLQALDSLESVNVEYKDRVMDSVYSIADTQPQAMISMEEEDTATIPSLDKEVNADKVGVSVTISPESHTPQPDLEVCEFCEESLNSM
jgi:hypothetical protein